jgi:hypothetical protein
MDGLGSPLSLITQKNSNNAMVGAFPSVVLTSIAWYD